MNRYLVRSLVAILTFSIGVAVGSFSRPSVNSSYREFKHKRCRDSAPPPAPQAYFRVEQHTSPAVSVDSASTDPVKLTYSQSRLIPGTSRQTVEFEVEANSRREVSNFTVNYQSRWSSRRETGREGIYTNTIRTLSSGLLKTASVAIDCDSDETLSVWIASVEFTDGSRWENPRHVFN